MVLDTNMFETLPEDCKGLGYPDEAIEKQIRWFQETLMITNAKWNIIIGHIPYKATGHKKELFMPRFLYT